MLVFSIGATAEKDIVIRTITYEKVFREPNIEVNCPELFPSPAVFVRRPPWILLASLHRRVSF